MNYVRDITDQLQRGKQEIEDFMKISKLKQTINNLQKLTRTLSQFGQ